MLVFIFIKKKKKKKKICFKLCPPQVRILVPSLISPMLNNNNHGVDVISKNSILQNNNNKPLMKYNFILGREVKQKELIKKYNEKVCSVNQFRSLRQSIFI